MPRNTTMTRRAAASQSVIIQAKPKVIVSTATAAAVASTMQKPQPAPIRKPVITTVSSAQRQKKREFIAPISPTEASVAPAYYNNGNDGKLMNFA